MKFAYKFSNLLGTVYKQGNLIFTPDGNSVISPVGNRITVFDLKSNKAKTLCVESRYDYTALDLSPNGCLLVAVNEKGQAAIISMVSQTQISEYKFSRAVGCVRFSPNGKFFAVIKDYMVFVFRAPGGASGEYNSFVVERVIRAGYDELTWIAWSDDSQLLAVGSKDNCTRVYGVHFMKNFRPFIVAGHTAEVVGCFFEGEGSLNLHTISRNGQLCLWECSLRPEDLTSKDKAEILVEPTTKKAREEEESSDSEDEIEGKDWIEREMDENDDEDDKLDTLMENEGKGQQKSRHPFFYRRLARHYLADEPRKENPKARLTAAAYHKQTKLLIAAFSTGAFYLYELPDVTMVHSLSISDHRVDTCCFNATGDWIALGVRGMGQLLVWEWQSEQYVMKQQGHSSEMNAIAYSPDGQYMATGGEDAKVKLWNVLNGFCFVTFHEHTAGVTGVQFSHSRKFLVSASLDGTVRAFDIIRYRNFKTFTSPRLVQFACVALDHSGELVAAGGQDVFEIFLWSVKFGHLLEILSGHEGPVVSLAFSPLATASTLVSASWDQTIKIWDSIETSSNHETVDLLSDALCVAFKPNGEEVAVATLNGNISVFNVKSAAQVATIEGRHDLGSGVSEIDLVTAKKNLEGKAFRSIAYSADGECLLAGGASKNVCIYHVREQLLLKKFEITQNLSFDGMAEYINRRQMTDFGNMALIEQREELEGGAVAVRLPGVLKGDMAARSFRPEIKVFAVRFSPSGQSWAAATTEGLLIYSLDKGIVFDPFYLSMEVTPKAIRERLGKREHSAALIMALKLNEQALIEEVMEQIPCGEVELLVATLPDEFAHRALIFVSRQLAASRHLEFYLRWSNAILTQHGQKEGVLAPQTLISLQQSVSHKYELLNKICDFNKFTIRVLRTTAKMKIKEERFKDPATEGEETGDENLLLMRPIKDDEDEDMSEVQDGSEE